MEKEKAKRLQKVAPFQIVKPVNMSWDEFSKMLRDVRYRLFRLANMAVSEAYLNFHKRYRMGQTESDGMQKISNLDKLLRKNLMDEGVKEDDLSRYSRNGAVSGHVYGAFDKTKLRAVKSKSKWRDIINGRVSLPVFRKDLAIPINCSDSGPRMIEKTDSGEYEVDLRICRIPYPRVLLSIAKISDGQRVILERLVSNKTNSLPGYRHRFFEVKEKRNKWFLSVSYDFLKSEATKLHNDIIVGVDLGWSVPFYAAINNGHARIGSRKLKALGDNIKALQKQIISRRRSIQNTGAQDLAGATARAGHGRKRLLAPTEKLEGKINDAYRTLNHQLSHCIIEFAKNHGAGVIQIENLSGLSDELSGTFIGQNWRYRQLQEFIKYKAEETGITVNEVNPRYTSRRCSECGYIHIEFDKEYRDKNRQRGKATMFECPECDNKLNADYNAARNLATAGIEDKILLQCKKQGIECK